MLRSAAERRAADVREEKRPPRTQLHAAFDSWEMREGGITRALTHHDAKRPRKCIIYANVLSRHQKKKAAVLCASGACALDGAVFAPVNSRQACDYIDWRQKLMMEPKINQLFRNVSLFTPKTVSQPGIKTNFTLHWQVTIFASSLLICTAVVFSGIKIPSMPLILEAQMSITLWMRRFHSHVCMWKSTIRCHCN